MTRIIVKNSSTAEKRPNPANLLDGELAANLNGSSPGLFFKNSSGNLVKVGPVAYQSTAPNASPPSGGATGNCEGELWADTSSGAPILKIYTGSTWKTPFPNSSNLTGNTDQSNTALGIGAKTNVSGVCIGVNAGTGGGTNGNRVNIGYNAKGSGDSSVIIGAYAGETTGPNLSGNVFIGYQAGQNAQCSQGTFIGYQAGKNAKAGMTAVGYGALSVCTGSSGTAVGIGALGKCTTGGGNLAIGIQALGNITTGSNNTAIGETAGESLSGAASGNICVGMGAGTSGAGTGNVCVGNGAGAGVTGSNNLFIGLSCTAGAGTNGSTVIGTPPSLGALSGEVLLCDNSGNIRLRFNSSGAMSPDGTSYGTSGAALVSQGPSSPPKWAVGATGSFVSHDGSTVVVENGVITQVY